MRDPQDIKRATQKATPVAPNIPSNIAGYTSSSLLYDFSNFDLRREVRNAYRKNSLIGSAIGLYQRTFPQARFSVTGIDGKGKGNPHVQRLLSRPNPEQSESLFKINLKTNLLNFSECFVLKGRNSKFGGVVTQLWCYNRELMRPIYDGGGYLSGYLYNNPWKPNSRRIYKKEDVIHLKWPSMDPENPNISVSPVEQVALLLETDNEIDRAVLTYLKNDLMRGNMLKLREGIKPPTPDEAKIARELWAEQTTGDSRGIPPWLTGIEDVIRLSGKFDELDSENIRKAAETRVASIFAVRPEVLGWLTGSRTSTFNNVQEYYKQWLSNTFAPMLDRIAEDIQYSLSLDFGEDFEIHFDTSRILGMRQLLRDEEKHQMEQMNGGMKSRTEAREAAGLDPNVEVVSNIRYTVEGAKAFLTLQKDYFNGVIKDRAAAIETAVKLFGFTEEDAKKQLPIIAAKEPAVSDRTVAENGDVTPPITETERVEL